jgi:hypothetical protein
MIYSPFQLRCLVVHRHHAECELLARKIRNDERLALLNMVDSVSDLQPLQWGVVPEVLFVGFNCCDAALVDYIQHLRKQIPIVFIVRKYDVAGNKRDGYPYVFFYDLIERQYWNDVVEKVVREKEELEKIGVESL